MHLVTATLRIYRLAAADAARAFARSALAFVLLLLAFPVLVAAAGLAGGMGIAGGFFYSLLQAAVVGTYLTTLQDALSRHRAMDLAIVRSNLGRHSWDVIGVLFPLWLLDLLLGVIGTPSLVLLGVSLVIAVLLNPVPEMIGRARSRGVDLLQDALTFMQGNGVEWLVPQVLVLAVPVVLYPALGLTVVSLFGPRFGFIHAGGLALSGGLTPLGVGGGLLILASVHLFMLFRGALFTRLGEGGRRARAWRARLEP